MTSGKDNGGVGGKRGGYECRNEEEEAVHFGDFCLRLNELAVVDLWACGAWTCERQRVQGVLHAAGCRTAGGRKATGVGSS
jgi:hypothetical protein